MRSNHLRRVSYDGGRMSTVQEQNGISQELHLVLLSFYKQYLELSTIYYSIDEKNTLVKFAPKAVITCDGYRLLRGYHY